MRAKLEPTAQVVAGALGLPLGVSIECRVRTPDPADPRAVGPLIGLVVVYLAIFGFTAGKLTPDRLFVGIAILGMVYALALATRELIRARRPDKVLADADGLTIVRGGRSERFPWSEVRGVERIDARSCWRVYLGRTWFELGGSGVADRIVRAALHVNRQRLLGKEGVPSAALSLSPGPNEASPDRGLSRLEG